MRLRRIAIWAAFAAGLAVLPFSAAKAQYYYPCNPFPLTWPFCIAGAAVGTAAAIVTAPVAALSYPYGYYGYPYYYGAAYPAPAWRPGWRYRRWCINHPYQCRR